MSKAEQEHEQPVIIYTDGACSGNPGPGGWGAIMRYKNTNKEISGYELHTTNNQMELLAAIEALSILKRKCSVEIYTDSIYVKNGITVWIHGWIENNWRKKHSSEVKNKELWQKLHSLCQKHNIIWHWVKGHSNNPGNIAADALAVAARKKAEQLASVSK
ncbi:MAG: ribonuclease HI [Rickettsiaceae bacterium]|nr:ribonuclease HI [Rickettsiaceae bacterium]